MQRYSEIFSGCGIFEMSGYSHEPGWCHPGEMRILAAKVSLLALDEGLLYWRYIKIVLF